MRVISMLAYSIVLGFPIAIVPPALRVQHRHGTIGVAVPGVYRLIAVGVKFYRVSVRGNASLRYLSFGVEYASTVGAGIALHPLRPDLLALRMVR